MPTPERNARIAELYHNRLPGVVVVLEDVFDPHNAAAILRSCDGLGVGTVYYLFEQTEPYDPRTVGKLSSSTANQWVTIETFIERAALEAVLRAGAYTSIATMVHEPAAEELWQTDLTTGNLALWVGNEHTGLSQAAIQFCDRKLTIPMQGMVESFNVSVATALILAEIGRQRRAELTS